ncbi:hydroxyacid dehydrogenase [Candidatus Poribacteria bacterium]|nr:hydroxyacid dehydrogenase [Candidatus Poribacteria bacterium]MBT5536626.1 hydroxyacid dehydrogenase [Candidatus Poribacteria bacterium]MBT7098403.1 hydroxyacid dehydrogenase [Candidatus Poribacteria bacterium]MBT7808227.1 hydroxyacid dehydrogenase [Candidatus Poribacteria bacterium]
MSKWNVILTSPIHHAGTDALDGHAAWSLLPDLEEATVIDAVREADGMIVRAFGYFGPQLMDAGSRLKVIGRHGVGVDNVDIEAATERGIWVVNTPEANAEAVAEHVIGSMLAFARRIVIADAATRTGDWSLRDRNYGYEVIGKTLGIVGVGRIGARVAQIAALGLNMDILYTDVIDRDDLERDLGAKRVPLNELLERSDVVTAHTPATPQTRGMFNADAFARMKDDALFINAARGPVVDEPAIIEALRSGTIGGACLDVFEEEPLAQESPLMGLPNVILSPHKAGQSDTSMRNMSLVSLDILRVLRGEEPKYPVNRPSDPR